MLSLPGGYGLLRVQRQTISSSLLQVEITLQKTNVNDVEQLLFVGNQRSSLQDVELFSAREFELVVDT
jgi:hypothetical protein